MLVPQEQVRKGRKRGEVGKRTLSRLTDKQNQNKTKTKTKIGKTDVAVQILSNLYKTNPKEKTLLVTHSNQALNHLFDKLVKLDVDEVFISFFVFFFFCINI